MNSRILIDGIVRQTTVLLGQLSTAAGVRSPLAHVADEVFLSLAHEIERQGVSRKVVADMFGMALRSYQRKVQRLEESHTRLGKTLWEAVLEFVEEAAPVRRDAVLRRFGGDDELSVSSVLTDLVTSGFLSATGRGEKTVYRRTDEAERRALGGEESEEALAIHLWGIVFHAPGISTTGLIEASRQNDDEVRRALDRLLASRRVWRAGTDDGAPLHASAFVIPEGASQGWEVAVFDHFQAVARAIASKVQRRESPGRDVVGGTTLHFGVYPGHPFEAPVLGLLRRIRGELNDFWEEVSSYNRQNGITEEMCARVTFYFGQHVVERAQEPAHAADGKGGS